MKVYLSYPMTHATPADIALRRETRARLREMEGVEIYDPEVCEPKGMNMDEIQEWDFARMVECDALLAIWSSGAGSSGGLLEELGWARRVFSIPVCIYRPDPRVRISPWTVSTVFGNVVSELEDAVRLLRYLSEGRKREEVVA